MRSDDFSVYVCVCVCVCVCVEVIWLANLSQMEGSAHVWRSDITVSMETSPSRPSKPSITLYCAVVSQGGLHQPCVRVFVHVGVHLHDCACVYSTRAFVWWFPSLWTLCIIAFVHLHRQWDYFLLLLSCIIRLITHKLNIQIQHGANFKNYAKYFNKFCL